MPHVVNRSSAQHLPGSRAPAISACRVLPLPFGEHGSRVRPSIAAGIAGLAARVSSAVLIFAAATSARRPTGPRCCPPRSVSCTARPQDPYGDRSEYLPIGGNVANQVAKLRLASYARHGSADLMIPFSTASGLPPGFRAPRRIWKRRGASFGRSRCPSTALPMNSWALPFGHSTAQTAHSGCDAESRRSVQAQRHRFRRARPPVTSSIT